MTLSNGVTIAAPGGFCIDTQSTRQAGRTASVLLASCANLGGAPSSGPVTEALIVISLVSGSHGATSTLREDLSVDSTRLARKGTPAAVHSLKASRAAVYANLTDLSDGAIPGTDPTHWKALFDVRGHAAVASIFGAPDGALRDRAGEALARDTVQAVLDANTGEVPPSSGVIGIATPRGSSENTPQRLGARLRGLLGPAETSS